MANDQGALEGVLVATLEQAVAAPYASSRLADAGARVIKVERPEGDFARGYDRAAGGEASYFVWLNRGKESLVLDIKDPADSRLLGAVLAKADIFIQNLAPGAAARAGFGAADLRKRYPRLICCDISGYGDDNSYRDMRAYDMLVQAESGLASVTGTADEPSRVGVSVCDIAAGMYAYAAILEALIRRGRTGEGASIKVSLFDGLAEWMTVPLLHAAAGAPPKRVGLRHPSITPYESFVTADGGRIVISIQNEREWRRFAEKIVGRAEWATGTDFGSNVARTKNRESLAPQIAAVFAKETRDGMAKRLTEAEIAFGFVNTVEQALDHPALRWVEVRTPTGSVSIPAPPARVEGCEPALRPVPAIGEHTNAIRMEFGA